MVLFFKASSLVLLFAILAGILEAQELPRGEEAAIVRLSATRGQALEVWRITHTPAVRDDANYHNTQCWSPDGRYICFTHHGAGNKDEYGNVQRP